MASWLRRFYIPLLVQITVPYLLLALAVSAGATYIATSLILESVEERFTNQLIASAVQVQESLVRKEEDLLTDLRLLGNIQGVAAAVETGDAEALQLLLLPVALNDGVEYLTVLSPSGRVLLSVEQVAGGYANVEAPAGLMRQPLVTNVLAGVVDASGDKFTAVLEYSGGAVLSLSGPISQGSEVAGVLLVGRRVESLAGALREESLAQVSFYRLDGQVLASTLAEVRPLTNVQAEVVLSNQTSGSLILPLEDASISYSEIHTVWTVRSQAEGIVGVSLATNFLLQATQLTRNNALLLTTGSAVLVMLVGLWVAGRITEPISRLKAAAQLAAAGNLNVSVPAQGRDEIGVLAESFNHMLDSLNESKQELLDAYEKTIEGWARATDLRDHETEGHSRRVAELTVALARKMGIGEEALVDIRRGALLHDIGKIAVPDSILLKAGRLTNEQLAIMRKHPERAREFIQQIGFLKPALTIPYCHHERWDGTGYPRGLKGTQIPLEARIFAVVDVWDALISDRPYREAMAPESAMAYIVEQSGRHFDPSVVAAFQKLMSR